MGHPGVGVNEGNAVTAVDAEVKLVPVHVALPQLFNAAQLIPISFKRTCDEQ